VAERLGRPDGVLIVDDTGLLKNGSVSAGHTAQAPGSTFDARRSNSWLHKRSREGQDRAGK
jgi:hypothetical protein